MSAYDEQKYMQSVRTTIAPNVIRPGVICVIPQAFPAGFGPARGL